MNGTMTCVTSPMRVMPPRMTTAVTMTSTMPVMAGAMPNVARRLSATELACTMLPMPKAATDVSSANSVPSHGRPRPFRRTYIAPPRMIPFASGSR